MLEPEYHLSKRPSCANGIPKKYDPILSLKLFSKTVGKFSKKYTENVSEIL